MSDCQHKDLVVGETYNASIAEDNPACCAACGVAMPKQFRAVYTGHELQLGQMCGAFNYVTPVPCGCKPNGEIPGFWEPCGDGWTSDLFIRQRESVEVDTCQSEPAKAEDTRRQEAA